MPSRLDKVSRALFARLSEREDSEIDGLNDAYRGALEQTIERVVGDLPRDADGRLEPDPAALVGLRREFDRFGDEQGASLLLEQHVERVSAALTRQVDVLSDGWQRLGEDPLESDQLALSTLVKANFLDGFTELGRYHHNALRDAVMRQALGRATERDLRAELKRITGKAASDVDRQHHDAVIGYSRAVIQESAEQRGYEYFQYIGPDDSANRPFCDRHVDKVYTKEEIDALDNGQIANVFLTGGGYRCRHHWRPVNPSWFSEEEREALGLTNFSDEGEASSAQVPAEVEDPPADSTPNRIDQVLDSTIERFQNELSDVAPFDGLVRGEQEIVSYMERLRAGWLEARVGIDPVDLGITLQIPEEFERMLEQAPKLSRFEEPFVEDPRKDVFYSKSVEAIRLLAGNAPQSALYYEEGEAVRVETKQGVDGLRTVTTIYRANEIKYVAGVSDKAASAMHSHNSTELSLISSDVRYEDGRREGAPYRDAYVDRVNTPAIAHRPNLRPETIFHELGHWYEQRNARVLEASVRIIERYGGETIEFRDCFGDRQGDYREGPWVDDYAGFLYPGRERALAGTEMLTTAFESFSNPRDMARLYRKSPIQFAHAVNVIEGRYGHEKATHWD